MPAKRGPQPKGKVYPRPGNKYQAQIVIDGRLHSQTFTSKAAAIAHLGRMRGAGRRPDRKDELMAVEHLRLGDALQKRIDALSDGSEDAGRKRRQLRRIQQIAEALCRLRLNDILPADIAAFRDECLAAGDAPATVCGHITRISTTFKWAQEQGSPGLDNPALRVNRPKQRRKDRNRSMRYKRLDAEQEAALMRAAIDVQAEGHTRLPLVMLLQFALETTMRRGEIAAMQWEDIDWHGSRIYIHETKNGDERVASVWPSTIALLERLAPQDEGRVWGTASTISRAWRLARARAVDALETVGSKASAKRLSTFRLHDLRFEAICRLFETTTLTEREIASISGHRTPAMLWHYATNLRTQGVSMKLAKAQGVAWKGGNESAPTEAPVEHVPAVSPEWRRLRQDPERLRAAVRSMPIREIAADMGVSDVAVHKACARLGVDKPPTGYWLKREHRLSD